MTRQEFLRKSAAALAGVPFVPSMLLPSCKGPQLYPSISGSGFQGKIIIVGAGAAGLTAGYLLKKQNIDFQIIEAAPVYGGRLKKIDDFADFPIDLGAEWIHTDPVILKEISGNPDLSIDTIDYNPQTLQAWKNKRLTSHNYIRHFYSEWKFKNSSWFDFFRQEIVPSIAEHILVDMPVSRIDYSGDDVKVKTRSGATFVVNKVLVTVPLKIIQQQQIAFSPALPTEKAEAFQNIFMGDGLKVFLEFKERFYPDMLAFGNIFRAFKNEEKFVYDAAFGKDSRKHVLGLFAINEEAARYTSLGTEAEIVEKFIAELDEIFDGKASRLYRQQIVQNWSAEPFIRGAYSYSFEGKQREIVNTISSPVANRVYFAGEALSVENQAMVHGACESAYSAVDKMLDGAGTNNA